MSGPAPTWGSWQTWYQPQGSEVTGAPTDDQLVFLVTPEPRPALDLQGAGPLADGFALGGSVLCTPPEGYVVDHVRLTVAGWLSMTVGCQVQLTCMVGGETSAARWRTTDGLPEVTLDADLDAASRDGRARPRSGSGEGVMDLEFAETAFLQERFLTTPVPVSVVVQARRRSTEQALLLTISDVVLEPVLRAVVTGEPEGRWVLGSGRPVPATT